MKTIEYKSISGKVKDIDEEKRIVTGYFTSTGTLDSDGDIFADGAFRKTIKERGPSGKNQIWHLWQHDTLSPINKPYKLEETKEGVYFETMFPQNAIADLALSLYKAGANPEHSVGFEVLAETQDKKARVITQSRMWEGSTVLWGANENTPFTGLKSAEKAKERIDMFEKLLKNATFSKDEIYELLYREIEQLKAIIIEPAQDHSTDQKPKRSSLPKISINI
ncbi:MAG: HK97 family phage prohead protease [Cryomorphaceae bacterium]|nr:MAG: HK97 family phage prohead protease [Cryomorphaceae bacterium]